MEDLGRLFLIIGAGFLILGLIFVVGGRLPILREFGSLPGDIRVEGENFACFAPIVSMIILSIVATIVINVIARLLSR